MAVWRLADLARRSSRELPSEPVYRSEGKWLHPLFDLLESSRPGRVDGGELFLRDRIIGRAAAFLILRSGIRDAWGDRASDGAIALVVAAGARFGWTERIEAIGCQTESLLRDVDDPELAWQLLLERRTATRSG